MKKKNESAAKDGSMSLSGHLRELRNRIIVVLLVFIAGVVVCFASASPIVELLTAMGEGKEILPYLLLSGQTVPVVTTMNAGELYVFFRLRTCSRAQWEIREIATDMLKCLREKYPRLFNLYGPTCFVTGKCPEGKMCCGKTVEMKEKFSGTL